MFRIINRNIFFRKNAFLTFKQIYGVGNNISNRINVYSGILPESSLTRLSNDSIAMTNIRYFLRTCEIFFESNLRRRIEDQIQKLIRIRSYRGNRHLLGFPTRGQRTHTNARTMKRKKKKLRSRLTTKPRTKGKSFFLAQSKRKKSLANRKPSNLKKIYGKYK